MNQVKYVAPEDCPLCKNKNNCANLTASEITTKGEVCWCSDKNISFPESLLAKVPEYAKNKACICKSCALQANESIKK